MPSEAPLAPAGIDADAAKKPEVAAGVAEVAEVLVSSTPRFAAVQRGRTRTIHFVRHAQATHNEAALTEGRQAYSDQAHLDARLTALGKQQCAQLQPHASKLYAEIELVVVSPMSRALETATLCFEQVITLKSSSL
jgi:Histidine phosphatase superfamily (branch 1)